MFINKDTKWEVSIFITLVSRKFLQPRDHIHSRNCHYQHNEQLHVAVQQTYTNKDLPINAAINYMLAQFNRNNKGRRQFAPVLISYFQSYTQISASRHNFLKCCSYKIIRFLFKNNHSWIKLRRPWGQTLCEERSCKNRTICYWVNFISFSMT
jgi:hypothetical protein